VNWQKMMVQVLASGMDEPMSITVHGQEVKVVKDLEDFVYLGAFIRS